MASAIQHQRTSNPVFNDRLMNSFGRSRSIVRDDDYVGSRSVDTVTVGGAATKTAILTGIVMLIAGAIMGTAIPIVNQTGQLPGWIMLAMIGGLIGGLVMALWTIFVPTHSPITAPIYAIFQGFAMGGVSTFFELQFQGIVFQAVGITFGALFAILGLYGSGIIKVNDTYRAVILGSMFAIFFIYLITLAFGLFGVQVPFLHDMVSIKGGWMAIAFSGFVCVIATLSFALDFQNIVDARQANAPKWFEWYLGFGLLVTMIWLYLEVLRLLAKIRSNE
jgi:uncharacterized YccA/Bax inhibitor family protein